MVGFQKVIKAIFPFPCQLKRNALSCPSSMKSNENGNHLDRLGNIQDARLWPLTASYSLYGQLMLKCNKL